MKQTNSENRNKEKLGFQNSPPFQKIYASEMQKPPFADGVKSLSTNPLERPVEFGLTGGMRFSHHCYICFVCLRFFFGVGDSFVNAFRLYLRCNQRKGEDHHAGDSKLMRSDPPSPSRSGLRDQRAVGTDHCAVHHPALDRVLRNERKRR